MNIFDDTTDYVSTPSPLPLFLMVNQNELPYLLSAVLLVVALKVKAPLGPLSAPYLGIVYVCISLIFVCEYLKVLLIF